MKPLTNIAALAGLAAALMPSASEPRPAAPRPVFVAGKSTPPAHNTKRGPGRRSAPAAPLLPVGMKMLKGVTSAPSWPGGKAYTAKQSLRRSMGTL